ncbi:MAG: NAD(P)-dependent oxidoreductase [Candidatus Aminicenantes bacterium]|jgi:nucleoside-diphosphate-sugar epimerase
MKIFVTGGTGFIGSHLIDHFLDQKNTEIFALVRDSNNLKWLKGLKIHLLEGDLLNIPTLPPDIDYIYHIAGSTKAYKIASYYTVNQLGTASLFQALESQNIRPKRVVYLSSLAASGPCADGTAVMEDSAPCPVSPYGKSKLEGEVEALKYKEIIPVVIARIGVVFGPRDRGLIPYFKFIQKGFLPSVGSKQKLVSLIYIQDLIEALKLCIHKELTSGEIFHLANPDPSSWEELGRLAAEAMNVKLINLKFPLPLAYLVACGAEVLGKLRGDPSILNRQKFEELKQDGWVADTQRAKEKLDFSPRYSLKEALHETIDWYVTNGWL